MEGKEVRFSFFRLSFTSEIYDSRKGLILASLNPYEEKIRQSKTYFWQAVHKALNKFDGVKSISRDFKDIKFKKMAIWEQIAKSDKNLQMIFKWPQARVPKIYCKYFNLSLICHKIQVEILAKWSSHSISQFRWHMIGRQRFRELN